MKKVLIVILTLLLVLVGLFIWQGEAITDMIFYDMEATMDLPENLFDAYPVQD